MKNHGREHFPLFTNHAKAPVYFDNASTTLKPYCVIEKLKEVYSDYPVNVHRGGYGLSEKATHAYEDARKIAQKFINAASFEEIIFTTGTTESINLVSQTFGLDFINSGDEIVVTTMEHHSNLLPWKFLCDRKGALLKVVSLTDNGQLDMEAFRETLSPRTRLVCVTYISNVLGYINPIETITVLSHQKGAKVLVDAAQAVAHLPIDVQKLDVDFLCFSSHKVFGPFGVGILYAKKELLSSMPAYRVGGGMIEHVSENEVRLASLPSKFEAGTPSIADAIAFGEALRFVEKIGYDTLAAIETRLTDVLVSSLKKIPSIRMISAGTSHIPLVSFVMEGMHPHDLSTLMDDQSICLRAGHHCSQPLMQHFGVTSMNRVSLAFYNTEEEINYFIRSLLEVEAFR